MSIHETLLNLLLGIIAGIISGIIVSRFFCISESIETKIEQLRLIRNHLYELKFHLKAIEIVLKQISDTSDEIKNKIDSDPTYLKNHDIIDADELLNKLKCDLIDKTIEKANALLNTDKLLLNSSLQTKTQELLSNIKRLSDFKFSLIDNKIVEIDDVSKEYTKIINTQNNLVLKNIFHDWLFIILVAIILILIILLVIF